MTGDWDYCLWDDVPPLKKREYKAYCTSIKCVRKVNPPRHLLKFLKSGIEKPNAKRNQVDCPDCGAALCWRKAYQYDYQVR